jgi:EpsD family peptidyl-prolyl cis-trans isomerase
MGLKRILGGLGALGLASGLLSMAISTPAFAKTPGANVVATVNGQDISLQELNAEIADMNLPAGADKTAARRSALEKIVNRTLLAQEARKKGLDKDPTFLMQQQRLTKQILVALYARNAMNGIPAPDSATVQKFMSDNPGMFAKRTLYTLDQIQFDAPSDSPALKELGSAHSLDAVAQTLTRTGIKFQRGTSTLDSGKLPTPMLQKILSVPKGEPFITPSSQPGKGIVSVISSSEPIFVSGDEQRTTATQALRTLALGKLGEQQLKDAKIAAKIDYQPGYTP